MEYQDINVYPNLAIFDVINFKTIFSIKDVPYLNAIVYFEAILLQYLFYLLI